MLEEPAGVIAHCSPSDPPEQNGSAAGLANALESPMPRNTGEVQ